MHYKHLLLIPSGKRASIFFRIGGSDVFFQKMLLTNEYYNDNKPIGLMDICLFLTLRRKWIHCQNLKCQRVDETKGP